MPNQELPPEVILDSSRAERTGLQEAIFCAGKSQGQLSAIGETVVEAGSSTLFTRLNPEQYQHLQPLFANTLDYDPVSATALYKPEALQAITRVSIVTGGSSDIPVAREALRTLRHYGFPALVIDDVGVAGLWRLMQRVDDINQTSVTICIAGMDAALPTVLGGLVSSCLIAVPTSVGYGMTRQGETALNSLLVSCAPGLTVVNIDNGYGAACAAIRILNQIIKAGIILSP